MFIFSRLLNDLANKTEHSSMSFPREVARAPCPPSPTLMIAERQNDELELELEC